MQDHAVRVLLDRRPGDVVHRTSSYQVGYAHHVATRAIGTARGSASIRDAERRLQELLLEAGDHNPLRHAARLVDGPLAPLFAAGAER